ncbi:D-alanyl-D-alanine carboxypeptidase family protein [Aquisalibacillus elongatus]|uniref:D-alanyl-D-alanine carboxypeptidase/D-alanyl-D-alanine carboxypeptidase (Penicillin-binding protein 5/6) n=1 Tax=Aquisalibacillus elongatus TaxID=485577 RepID=A0A3N5BDT0_9BACI|nr:D-alanyl-D-alanine carboxypeptidase family protein [Aquisalibacillus elongatus]RPF55854.1 D-alanyl-D-alanine carboxypeptidase/D-alanyl-D-alanine carboxypeptidase (penicillin-binding protein 5/6) [Aquisalibacillus elongatus]
MKLLFTIIFTLILLIPNHISAENINIVNSDSAILIDAQTGEVLYDKNSEQTMYPASITKIITAIVAIEEGNLEDTVTVSEDARNTPGTRVFLEEGEKVKLDKLVKGLLINSGNDAGVAIAEHMDGSVDAFTNRMNRFVKEEIGVKNSHFENPHGLYDSNHTTTATDMALITQYAMNNETFREIAGIKSMPWDGEKWETTLYNHHQLVRQRDDVTGVKNGFVSQAGFTLVTTASREHIDLIAVTMKSPSAELAYEETENLLDYGFENYQTYTVAASDVIYDEANSEYILESDFQFTAEKALNWEKDFDNQGNLLIKNENDQTIVKHSLTNIEVDEDKERDEYVDHETKSNSVVAWGLLALAILVFKFFIYKWIRKRRRRRHFFR